MTAKVAVKGEAKGKDAICGNVASSDDPCGYLFTGRERKVESAKQKLQTRKENYSREYILLLLLELRAFLRVIPRTIRTRDSRASQTGSRPNDELLAAAGAKVLSLISPFVWGVGAHRLELRHAPLVGQVLRGRAGAFNANTEPVAPQTVVADALLSPR
jgi:hypothetical protein